MANVLMFHGAYGNPEENWFPWLKSQLEHLGHAVHIPAFPTPKDQTLENWFKALAPFEKYIDSETVFVSHSLGALFIPSVLEKMHTRVKATFLVAGFLGRAVDPQDKVKMVMR